MLSGKQKKYCSGDCNKLAARAEWIKKVYALDLVEVDIIWELQDERCPICLRRPRSNETFHIDHEHGGHVRGIICPYCNTRLVGKLKDHEKAQRLADYLRDPPAVKALGERRMAPGRPPRKRQPRKRKR